MKLLNTVILYLLLLNLFISCNNEDIFLNNSYFIAGEINNADFYKNRIDSVYGFFFLLNDQPRCRTKATKIQDGRFLLKLPILTDDQLVCKYSFICGIKSFVSDTTIKLNFLNLGCSYKGFGLGSMFLKNDHEILENGFIQSSYVYCNKKATIKGIRITEYPYKTYTETYTINLQKGWNVISEIWEIKDQNTNIKFTSLPQNVSWHPRIMIAMEPNNSERRLKN